MAEVAQSKAEAKKHAQAIEEAAGFFADLAKRGQLPLTPAEFNERVRSFYEGIEVQSNALLLAVLKDEPCPQSLFQPWASTTAIYLWRTAKNNPLPVEVLNGKIMVRPTAFFAALREHGRAAQ